MSTIKIPTNFYRILGWLIIIAGILLRLIVYLQNRSLFLDEANLSRNIVEKSFPQFFTQLSYEQYAPPFYLCIQKILIVVLGVNEYALRLLPLLAGIFTLFLFYQLLQKNIATPYRWFPLALMAFSIYFVQYASEVKQYSTDIFTALVFLLIPFWITAKDLKLKQVLFLAIVGASAIWFSMSIVFILAGVGICYLFQLWQLNKRQEGVALIGAIVLWLISFGAYYWIILRQDIGSDYLQNFHANWFLPLIPTSSEQLFLFKNIMLSFFRTSIGSTTLAIAWGMIAALIGLYHSYKKDIGTALLLSIPILACFFASAIHYYTLIPRLTLFFMPIILIWIGIGTAKILAIVPGYFKVLIVALLLVITYNRGAFEYYFQRFEIEELKPVMTYLAQEKQSKDIFYVFHSAVPAYTFYDRFHQNAFQFHNTKLLSKWDDLPSKFLHDFKGQRKWIIFSHASEAEVNVILNDMRKLGKEIKSYKVKGAACYLYE